MNRAMGSPLFLSYGLTVFRAALSTPGRPKSKFLSVSVVRRSAETPLRPATSTRPAVPQEIQQSGEIIDGVSNHRCLNSSARMHCAFFSAVSCHCVGLLANYTATPHLISFF